MTAVLTATLVLMQVPSWLWPQLAPAAAADAAHFEPARISAVSPVVSSDFAVGARPRGVAVDPASGRAYVSNTGTNTVTVLQLGATPAATTTVGTITVGTGPRRSAISPATNELYVPNYTSGGVSVIDLATNTVLVTLPAGSGPLEAAYHAAERSMYIANNAGGGDVITKINVETRAASSFTVPGSSLSGIAVNNATGRVYAIANAANALYVIQNSAVIATVPLGTGANPSGIAVNELTDQIWVSLSGGVALVNGDTNAIVHTFSVAAHEGLALNAAANRTYVPGGSGGFSVLNGAPRTTTALPAGSQPTEAAVASNGLVVVTNYFDNNVTVVQEDADAFVPKIVVSYEKDSCCTATDGVIVLREAFGYADGTLTPAAEDRRLMSGGSPGAGSADRVLFDIGAFPVPVPPAVTTVIGLLSGLPALTGGDSIFGDARVVIQGAAITTPSDGIRVVGNGSSVNGLVVSSFSTGIAVNGTAANTRISANILTYNTIQGISIGTSGPATTILGNYVGTGPSGRSDQGNGPNPVGPGSPAGVGILVAGSGSVQIGDGTEAGRNVISGNVHYGVRLIGNSATTIRGNYIGTKPDGLTALGNGSVGVDVNNAAGGTIRDNVIAGNACHGVYALNSDALSITGNLIGVGADGTTPLTQGCDGIVVIGGSDANVLTDNTIENNAVGIVIAVDSANNAITGGRIRSNRGEGIRMGGDASSATTRGNRLSGGSVTANGGKGILLMSGANDGIVPPVVTEVQALRAFVIRGTGGAGNLVNVYIDTGDEGAEFLGTTTVNADGVWQKSSGWSVTDTAAIQAALRAGTHVATATQTNAAGSTSEFSTGVGVPAVVAGLAQHRETVDGTAAGTTTVTLAGATVTLLNADGSHVVNADGTNRRTSAGADGWFEFSSLAANTTYAVGYDGAFGGRNYLTGVRFTTDARGGASVPIPYAFYNRGNHTWITAFTLPDNTPVLDQVWRRGQATWYRFPITPQQQVTVELTGCDFNCDLVVYRDLQQVHEQLLADAQTQEGIRQSLQGDIMADDLDADDLDADDLDADDLDADDLDADDLDADDLDADDLDADDLDADDLDADDLDADDLDADDLDADDLDADDLDADDLDADDLDADDLDADDLDADDLDADDLDADDLDADDLDADGDGLTGYGTTYVAAQRKGLRAASLTAGLAPETVVINTRSLTGHLYVRVAGGASLAGVFRVTARRADDASCIGAPLTSRAPSTMFDSAVVGGKRSLILTDTSAYGLTSPARETFLATLGTFATHPTVQGHVVDLAGDANIQLLRADWLVGKTCVAQANLVTDATREVVQRFRAATGGSFEYLINVGGDSVIPFRRVADWAEISRESRYNPPLAALTASEASLVSDTFLNDDFYVSEAVDGPNRTLYLPDAAVGRLVESVEDVNAYIAMYLDANGTASPTTALSSGYDFNIDLADYVTSRLTLSGLSVDSSLVSDTWSSADWRAKVLERAVEDAFGILSLQGHFTANRLVPADNGQRVLSSELAAIDDGRFLNALVYSLGCHSGYSIVDADGSIFTQEDAFPEVFVRKGATVVAGTGYQYGETVLMKNTEALIALLTEELGYRATPSGAVYGPNGVPIGKALMYAKRAYMGSTATPRGIDLKVVGVSTVYGSPTMSFKLPSPQARPTAGTLSPAQVADFSGLTALDVVASDALTPVTIGGGTYYTAGGETTTAPYRPIAPLETIDANVPGSVLQGSVFLGGAYDEINFTPRLSIPATELGGEAPRYANDVFMPVLPVRSNLFDGDALQVVPFQYRSNVDGTSGVARVFDSGVNVRAFWSSRTGRSAAADAPAIRDVAVRIENGQLVVIATLRGVTDPGISEVWLTYTDITATNKSFASIPMSPMAAAVPDAAGAGFTRLYRAELPGAPSAYRFLVQAVSGNGRVSAATNNGQLFGVPPVPPVQVDRVATTLELAAPANATYRSTISATATLRRADGQALSGKTVTFRLGGGASRTAVTGTDGRATATLDVNVTPRLAPPYTLSASFAGEAGLFSSTASAKVTVGKAATVLTAPTIAGSPQYSDSASVAKLTANGLTLNEQPIVITRDGVSVATFTDFAGEVRFDTMDFGAGPGDSVLTITYPGNERYEGISLEVPVTVRTEDATLTLPQDPQPAGLVTISAAVLQQADGSLGDLTLAKVAFTVTTDAGALLFDNAVAVSPAGVASFTSSLPVGLYRVTAMLVSSHFVAAPVAMTLPVYDPAMFASGGGWVLTGPSPVGVPADAKGHFAFIAKYLSDNVTPSVSLDVHVKSPTGKDNDSDAQAQANGSLKFKETTTDYLLIAGNGAAFTGTGTVNGATGYRYRVDVADGAPDVFVIHIWDPALSATAGGSYDYPKHIVRGTLGGGSVRIHR